MVRITTPKATAPNFIWPSDKELHELLAVVLDQCPRLKPSKDDDTSDYWRGFQLAFRRLAFMFRTEAPSHKYALTYWVSEANNWLHDQDITGSIGPGYLAAVLAHNDICYTPADRDAGVVWELGLSPYVGRRATDRWRKVLETRRLLAPTLPPRSIHRLAGLPRPRIYQEDPSGTMRLVPEGRNLW